MTCPLLPASREVGAVNSLISRVMRPRLIFAAGFLILFVGGGARYAIGLTFKPMVTEFGWHRGELGLAVGAYLVVSAFATYLAGYLADRMSPRLLLNAGVLISALGIGLMSLVTQPWQALLFYGVVFAIGSGIASLTPVGVIITGAFPARTGFANAAVISGTSAGQLVIIAVLANLLVKIGWSSVFVWLAIAHLAIIPILVLALPTAPHLYPNLARGGLRLTEALRTRQFWMLLVIYAICGLDDFFVATHVVAFAQDRGVEALLAGRLLALMGLTGVIGLMITGAASDFVGPAWTAALSFGIRIAVFGLIAVDQSTSSIAIFALAFGATFLVTAPLVVLFVRDHFGMSELGALSGLVTMVHQIFGGLGAYGGAWIFDATGTYDAAFLILLIASGLAFAVSLLLRRSSLPLSTRPEVQSHEKS